MIKDLTWSNQDNFHTKEKSCCKDVSTDTTPKRKDDYILNFGFIVFFFILQTNEESLFKHTVKEKKKQQQQQPKKE